MTKTIALGDDQKGGVGKTTNTANFGAALACQAEGVLLADADPQATRVVWLRARGNSAHAGATLTVG